MPIGGSAYYDKFKKKNTGATVQPTIAPAPAKAPVPVQQQPLPVKEKVLSKSVVSTVSGARPAKKMGASNGMVRAVAADPSALDDVVSQILDLAQRVHAVAGQAEAAVLRAEAAVLKAEVAVGKAEAAGSRADASFSKCDVAASRAEAAAFKADSSAKRAELSASKAGLAAGKSELASVGRGIAGIAADASSIVAGSPEASEDAEESAGEEDNRTKEINSPLSQIAVMSMKLRSGMRQIEEERERSADRNGYLRPGSNLNMTVGREDLASGLVSLDNDTMLPRVAPFIMDDVSHGSPAEPAKHDEAETDARSASKLNGVGSAA